MKNGTTSLLKTIEKLNDKEKSKLIESIMNMLSTSNASSSSFSCNNMVHEVIGEKPNCPHCQAEANLGFIIKKGFKKNVQRYQCKKCGKFFVATTNTAFENTRKDADTWRKFIKLTITGASLHRCADECGIAYHTAFTWRHKILNVFAVNQNNTVMDGVVEMDETFFAVSYKGNHLKGSFHEKRTFGRGLENDMPRRGYKRGSDNTSRSHEDRVCVMCMVEDGNKSFYGVAACTGYMGTKELDASFAKHVNSEKAFVIIDTTQRNTKYLDEKGYTYLPLLSNTSDNPKDHKAEIQGPYHLQHVNAMHSHLKIFLSPYCGVSSKYLQNYISLYVWLKNVASKRVNTMWKRSITRAAFSDCYISHKNIISAPALPCCA